MGEAWYLEVTHTNARRVRRVPLSAELVSAFRGRVGRLVPYASGSPGSFADRVRRLMGIEGFHVRQMRHTFACQWLEQGDSLAALQQVLGHARTTTTQRYARLTDEAVLREAATLTGHSECREEPSAMSPRSSKQHAGIWQFVGFLVGLLFVATMASCDDDSSRANYASSSDYSSGAAAAEEQPTDLDDGNYSCDATNDTRGNGPYLLSCDKSGDTITIHFDNGGYVDLDIESQERAGDGSWVLSGTDSRGDIWTLNIDD